MKKNSGVTLIELIVFIVIMAIIVSAAGSMFATVLTSAPKVHHHSAATQLASQCLEGYLGERYIKGYSTVSSATTPALCAVPTGYTITKSVTNTTKYGEASYKTITVTVAGEGNATMSLFIADY